jgi:hypothetical protein
VNVLLKKYQYLIAMHLQNCYNINVILPVSNQRAQEE